MIILKRKEIVVVCVLYYRPDYRHILQDFIWETEDFIPSIPRVHKFLNFWRDNIEAIIKEVIVSSGRNKNYNATNFYKVIQ